MKIQGAKKVHYDSGPNMTPLVDVVMVILIFLMLAGSFGNQERYLISDVPISTGNSAEKKTTDVPKNIKITMQQIGSFYTAKAGDFLSVNSSDPGKAFDTMVAVLKKQYATFQSIGVKPEDVQVQIIPDTNVWLANVVVVYEAINEAGFSKVGFAKPPSRRR